ncbi:mediator of RNA polymerase II transcription subunit 28 [Copidosoma floridanum]|uniref:mediator of RNA polymerase II transcription subunit 28 n=1 Tax=Copidosoma floridanum TaxID=29053 RepID=UPI0006C9CBB6|nr:mediator of RNA polymerase II transcription subunit 28 [Copidosoma floridanum]
MIGKDDTKIEVDQVTLRFIDLARQVEAFFLQKRFLLSALKPELVVKEDITDLKFELTRKEELIKKNYEKIFVWQNLLAEMHGWVQPNGSSQNSHSSGTSSNNSPSAQHVLQHQQIQQQQIHLQHQHLQHIQQQQFQQGTSSTLTSGLQTPGTTTGSQNIFMNQGNVTNVRNSGYAVGSLNTTSLQGPLAFLEKTTSNIGMPERRS